MKRAELVDLSAERARRAAELAADTGLRGADAVHVELAADRGDRLITWDRQQASRGRATARVATPREDL